MSDAKDNASRSSIRPIDKHSVHRITSGQVVIDLQTAVKELVENSLDAGATNLEVKFKQYGLTSIDVIDNGSGIAEEDYDSIGLKHHTSKLVTYNDLTSLETFGFRGEALSSLCALCQSVQVTTATTAPMGTCLELDANGRVKQRKTVARQRGTTVTLKGLFQPLPVRRKELERNVKREFAKALNLLNAYALLPCAVEPGVRLNVSNQLDKGTKTQLMTTQGAPSIRRSVNALWGPKALDNIVDLDLQLEVERERANKRLLAQTAQAIDEGSLSVSVRGLISKFDVACGRTTTDRQFLYVNGRPCTLNKVQKTFNEVYRSFNAAQSPFLVADFIIAPDACDVNVSPDKRTIFLHSENNLIAALKTALENHFDSQRATFNVTVAHPKTVQTSLDHLSTQYPRLTVTNNTARMAKHLSSLAGNSGKDIATSSLEGSGLRSTNLSTSAVTSEQLIDETTKPKEPLFILDPDDDINSAGSVTESIGSAAAPVRHSVLRAREQSSDVDVVVDTLGASWNRSTPSHSTGHSDRVPEHDCPDDEELPLEPPYKKHKPNTGDRPSSSTTSDLTETCARSAGLQSIKHNRPATGDHLNVSSRIRKGSMTIQKYLAGFASNRSDPTDETQRMVEDHSKERDAPDNEDEEAEEDSKVTPSSRINSRDDPDDVQTADLVAGLDESRQDHPPLTTEYHLDGMDVDDEDVSSVLGSVQQSMSSGSATSQTEPLVRPEIIRTGGGDDVSINFDFDKIRTNHLKAVSRLARVPSPPLRDSDIVLEDAGIRNIDDETRVAEVLSRIIDKTDFMEMEVIGQFNLGFIIARRRKSIAPSDHTMDDLFIVDQHAADEKYNFESLQQTTVIQSQKLFRPRPLELTASDEVVATENIDILRRNGFEIEIKEEDVLPGSSRLMLAAQPISKSTVFDMKDLEELIQLMRDRPNGKMVRCSKARAMFAMRACRKSVMVGMPMNRHQMLSVVHHMGTMDQPWNCPHGRPTMRYLANLEGAIRPKRELDWRRLAQDL